MQVDPEQALKRATAKFEKRFKSIEKALEADGKEMSGTSSEVLDQYWRRSKVQVP